MSHAPTSFEVIELLENIRNYLSGIASVGPKYLRKRALELIKRIDDAIGG